MTETTLLIARHGNTFNPGDVVTRVGGRTDMPLVESGMQQGLALGCYLKEHNLVPAKIFTSHMQRTIKMAEQVNAALGMNIPTEALGIFNEIDYGPDENRPEEEVVARIGKDALKAWEEQAVPPQGWLVDVEGLRRAWQELAVRIEREHTGQKVLLITHNGIARFAATLTGDENAFKAQYGLKLSTGALAEFVQQNENWTCKSWNIKPQ